MTQNEVEKFIDNCSVDDLDELARILYLRHPNEYLDMICDMDIQEEFACRGLNDENVNLSDFSDSEIEDEFEARGLVTEDDNSLALEIVHGINCGRDMSMAVTSLLEQLSGRLVCPLR